MTWIGSFVANDRPAGPVMFGYQRVRIDTSGDDAAKARNALVECARRRGLALAHIFVEDDENQPCSALNQLIDAAGAAAPAAVVAVPDATHLGTHAAAQAAMRVRIEQETGVPVLRVNDTDRHRPPDPDDTTAPRHRMRGDGSFIAGTALDGRGLDRKSSADSSADV